VLFNLVLMNAVLGQADAKGDTVPTVADAVKAAHADLARFPSDIRGNIRYLRRPPQSTDKEWVTWIGTLSGHCNGLSIRGDIRKPVPVGSQLLRIQLSHYGWAAETWEKLTDPYAVADAKEIKYKDVQKDFVWWGGIWPEDGKHYEKGAFTFKKWVKEPIEGSRVTTAVAPWMSEDGVKEQMAELAAWTYSVAPIVRADWFMSQTAIQEGRSPGYYDFLGVKNQKDFEKLIRFDEKLATELERRKVVIFSGVIKGHVRRVERTKGVTGALWRTFDSERAVGVKNPLVELDDKKFQFEATEQIGSLVNGMPAFYLGDNKGTRQDKAPDNIVGGYRRRGIGHNDSTLSINLSCIDCHTQAKTDGMIREIDFAPIKKLTAYGDYKIIEDLERQYIRDIAPLVRVDRQAFAAAIAEATGMETQAYGLAYLEAYGSYEDRRVDLKVAAADWGLTPAEMKACLDLEERTGYLHPSVSVIAGGRALPIRQYEEVLPIFGEIRYRHHKRKE
jgi:hypothetical protein